MSAKSASLKLAYAATCRTVRRWQRETSGLISRLKRRGYAIVVQDESFFVDVPGSGKKLWSDREERITAVNPGRHRRSAVVYGAISDDGTQLFELHDKFNAKTFAEHLESIRRKWGRVAVIPGNAKQHGACAVGRYPGMHGRDVRRIYLPKGSPQLSAIEECWRQAKRELLVAESYGSFERMRRRISGYLGTKRFKLDIYAFLERTI